MAIFLKPNYRNHIMPRSFRLGDFDSIIQRMSSLISPWERELYPFDDANRTPSRRMYDLHDNDKEYILDISAAGMDADTIETYLEDGVLTVKADKKERYQKERAIVNNISSFSVSIRLPEDIDDKNITGEYENGLISLRIPKGDVQTKKRRIEINKHNRSELETQNESPPTVSETPEMA